jgi:hypothetical protein
VVYQPEQRLTVEMRTGVFGEHREDEHAGAGSGGVRGRSI